MMNDTTPRSPGEHAGGEGHLSLDALLRLADGEDAGAAAAAHVATCARCAAGVDALAIESHALSRALALDEEETAFLAAAGVPQRVASLVEARAWGGFWTALAAVSAIYAGWLLMSPTVFDWLEAARRVGLGTIIVSRLAGWSLVFVSALASLVEAASVLPLVTDPMPPLAAMAAVAWLALAFAPRRRTA